MSVYYPLGQGLMPLIKDIHELVEFKGFINGSDITAIKEECNCRNCGANSFKNGKCEYCDTSNAASQPRSPYKDLVLKR